MNNTIHQAYRSDIDGLRAVAVMSVLIFHAFPSILPGGFVGVDVFFIISGFLITGILLNEFDNTTFSFKEFYARRIKRLYPALLLMLTTCLIYGYFVLLPGEFAQLAKHTTASSLFINNYILYSEVGYFDNASETKPLLHLWSLGIEEQFYLFWPLALFIAFRLKLSLPRLIGGATLISFALNIYYSYKKPTYCFFMPYTRFWELLLGGALAYTQRYHYTIIQQKFDKIAQLSRFLSVYRLKNLMGLMGIALILLSCVFLDKTNRFPGFWGLLPTIGSLLIILADRQSRVNSTILSSPLAVGIGLISYPLYLWHWPLLTFPRLIEGKISVTFTLFLLALSFVLAYLTYKLLEKPVRHRPSFVAIPLLSAMLPLAIVGFLGKKTIILPFIMKNSAIAKIVSEIDAWEYPDSGLKPIKYKEQTFRARDNGKDKILFFGDSNIEQYYPRIRKLMNEGKTSGSSIVFATYGGCPPIPNVFEKDHPKMDIFVDSVRSFAKDPSIKTVVIGAQWVGYMLSENYTHKTTYQESPLRQNCSTNSAALKDFEIMVREFVQAKKKVYIILNIPTGSIFEPRDMVNRTYSGQWTLKDIPTEPCSWLETARPILKELAKIAYDTGAIVIDPVDSLCQEDKCLILTKSGTPVYRDGSHLSPKYVAEHANFIDITMQ